jgi:hypothetical protein
MTRDVVNEPIPDGASSGSSLKGDLRVGARIARRSLRKHWVANLIVVLLIALPVAGIGAISTLVRTKLSGENLHAKAGQPRMGSELEQWGASDFRLHSMGVPVTSFEAKVWTNLPKGSLIEPESYQLCGRLRSTESQSSKGGARTRRVSVQLRSVNLASPVFTGSHALTQGTWAKQTNEIVVSTRLAKSLKLSPGDKVWGCGQSYVVTGVVKAPSGGRYANEAFLFPANDTGETFYVKLPKRSDTTKRWVGLDGKPFLLPKEGSQNQTVGQPFPPFVFNTPEMVSRSNQNNIENSLWVIRAVGVMSLMVLGALAGAVFMVSAQRQRQTAGLLSLTGASVRAVRAMLVLQGTLCGLLACIVGGVIGVVGLRAIVPYRNDIFSGVLDSYTVTPGDWLWAMAIAVAASTLAALRPAQTVAEGSLLHAGRDRSTQPHFWVTARMFALALASAIGFGILTTGSSSNRVNLAPRSWALPMALLAVASSVAAVWIGTPLLLRALTTLATRFRSLRLSARSLNRNPSRSAATMSGVAVVFGVLVAILLATSNATAYSQGNDTFGSGVQLYRTSTVPCAILNRPTTPIVRPVGPPPTPPTPPTPPNPPNPSAPVVPVVPVVPDTVVPDRVVPSELCSTPGLSDAEVLQAITIVGRPAVDIKRYQVNNSQSPTVTLANPELVKLLGLSSEERSILKREGIIDYSRFGTDISVGRLADGQLHNITSLGTPGLADLVREEVVQSASFTQVKPARQFLYPIGYLVTQKALLDPVTLSEKALLQSVSFVQLERPLTGEQRDELQEILDIHDGKRSLSERDYMQLISFPPPDDRIVSQRIRLISSGIAGAIALLAIALSLALSSVENRNDHQRLIAIGASPKTIRRLRTQSSALLAFGGCMIAVIVALPVFRMVLWAGDDRSDRVRHPIPFVVLTLTIACVTAGAAVLGLVFHPRTQTSPTGFS